MADQVLLRTFNTRYEAEIARATLAAAGIDALVVSDDCGSVDPGLAFGRGVDLLVATSESERAEELLSVPAIPDTQ